MKALALSLTHTLKRYKKSLLVITFLTLTYTISLSVIAPLIITAQSQKIVAQRLGLNLSIEKISINPFTLRAQIHNFEITQKNNDLLIGFKHFSVDIETISLINWAWTLDHITLTGLNTQFERFSETENTLSRLAIQWQASAPPNSAPPAPIQEQTQSELPRFLIRNIDLELSRAQITDQVPTTPFYHELGPLDIHIDALSTLPEHTGIHTIALKSKTGVEISWQGNIHLTPIASQGHINIKGPYPVIASNYLQDSLVVAIESGFFNADLNYTLDSSASSEQSPFKLLLDRINISLDDFKIIERATHKPLYSLQEFSVTNASLQWPEQVVNIPKIALNNAEIWISRDQQGQTNIEQLLATQQTTTNQTTSNQSATHHSNSSQELSQNTTIQTPPQTTTQPTAAPKPWTIANKRFELNNWQVNIKDNTIAPTPEYTIHNITLGVDNYQLKDDAAISFNYGLGLLGGKILGQGTLVPMPFSSLNSTVKLQNIQLRQLQPYITRFAKIALTDGQLNASTQINSVTNNDQQSFIINSDASIEQLQVLEADNNKTILQWNALTLSAINTSTTANALTIKKIAFNKPYIDFKINKDGTTSIDQVLIKQTESEPVQVAAKQESNQPSSGQKSSQQEQFQQEQSQEQPTEEQGQPYHFKVGGITVANGSGQFADASLPLPFSTKIHKLNGAISTLDSQSQASTDLDFKGQLDEYGLLNIEGALTPFAPVQKSHVNLGFKNINIPNFTPYAIKFAGRKITDGRLDLNLKYTLNDGVLQGENNVVLRSFNLGESVHHPGALDLPLDLAIGLLKDNDNNITLELPVDGDINNPEFSVASVLGQAFTKILTSAISSPFRLLAGIVGGEAEDFGKVHFAPGASNITPPELEKLHKLAKAMQARPKLLLKIPGTYSVELDTQALQQQHFLLSANNALGYTIQGDALTQKTTIEYLEQGFLKQNQELALFKQQFINQQDKKSFDTLAYAKALKLQLITQEVISDDALLTLGKQRAQAINSIIEQAGIDNNRVINTPVKAISKRNHKQITIELEVDTQP